MTVQKCKNCGFRAKYDANPKSILGRFWLWHANWCPGWKSYITSMPDDKRIMLAEQYEMEKYK